MPGASQPKSRKPADRRMSRRLMLTLSTSAGLSGLALVYSVVVNSVIKPPELDPDGDSPRYASNVVPPPLIAKQMADRWLAAEGWAAEAKYQTRTEDAFVYFEDWEPVDGDEAVRLRPFAMILLQKGRKEDEQPITVVSKSAYVRFSRKFDLKENASPGRVVFGSLEGEVRIAGPEGLHIVGRNFTYEEAPKKVHSDNDLQFAYGPHRGTARGLDLHLDLDEAELRKEKLAVTGVNKVQLRQNVVMDLEFAGGAPGREAEKAGGPPKPPDKVRVRSDGPFTFDVKTNVATFESIEKGVHVAHPTKPGKSDTLQCDLLTLYFEPETDGAAGEAAPEAAVAEGAGPQEAAEEGPEGFRSIGGDLAFRRMQADGTSVVLVSQANDMRATMHQLTYDARTRVATLTADDAVRVVQHASEMQSPRITLVHDEEGEVSRVVCQGAGMLRQVNRKTGALELAARWQDRLHKYPDAQSKLDVVELIGKAVVQQPRERMVLAANHMLRLWAEPQRDRNGGTGEEDAEERSRDFRPKRLLAVSSDPDAGPPAEHGVVINSPEMTARGKRLEVWFEPIPGRPDAFVPQAEKPSRASLQPAVQRVSWEIAAAESHPARGGSPAVAARQEDRPAGPALPSADAPQAGSTPPPPKREATEPIDLTADLIEVQVDFDDADRRRAEIRRVWTRGSVHVEQRHATGEPPLLIECERMRIRADGENDHVLDVYGSASELGRSANVYDRGSHIEGGEIHLDRATNDAWVKGEGLLELPVKETLEGEPLVEPQLLKIRWQDEMTFNGVKAMFYGDVRAALEESTLRCHEMEVQLTERVSFAEARRGPRQEAAKVHLVFCRDGVQFDSVQYDPQGVLTEVRRGEFAEMALDQQTGKSTADGPGVINVWRRRDPQQAAAAPPATVRANSGLASDAAEWEYLQVKFSKAADGNTKERTTKFTDRVNVLYGPVDRPPRQFTLEDKPEDAGWLLCETLHVTHHAKTDVAAAFAELRAQGNARVDGRGFQGHADTITYDQSKDLYVLRSLAPRKATLSRQVKPGQQPSQAKAQTFTFIPSKNKLVADQTTGLDGIR